MYKTFFKFNILKLIKIRLHLGHKDKNLNSKITSYLYGTRHNINIYNFEKLWKPYRYLFYSLTYNFSKRNSFFIIGTNQNLPMASLLENLLKTYPWQINHKQTKENFLNLNKFFYISGYIDRKWIGGLFTNWKIFKEFIEYLNNPDQIFEKKFKFIKYFFYLKGAKNLLQMPIPDFFIFFDKNEDAFFEINKLQIPLIGLIDTNMNPEPFLYKFFGNNDTIENIEFFFEFLSETVKEGRLIEQQKFYSYFIYKIKLNFFN